MVQVVTLVVEGSQEDTVQLAVWLEAEDELRGCVLREMDPVSDGVLGAGLAQLAVSLGSGGMATAAASVVIAWLRRRAGKVSVRLSRADGTALELDAERVKLMDQAGLHALAEQLAALAWPESVTLDDDRQTAEGDGERAAGA
jgi:hypothetical protein